MKYYTALEANPLASSYGQDSLTTYPDCAMIGFKLKAAGILARLCSAPAQYIRVLADVDHGRPVCGVFSSTSRRLRLDRQ
jgi:hypothetical protein